MHPCCVKAFDPIGQANSPTGTLTAQDSRKVNGLIYDVPKFKDGVLDLATSEPDPQVFDTAS